MSPSSIISSRSRSRRRLTRSSGANGKMPLTSCFLPTVRVWLAYHPTSLPRSGEIDQLAYLEPPPRQDHQIMESFRKIAPCCVGIQSLGWPKKLADSTVPPTSQATQDDPTRQHHRRRPPQGLRQRSRIPHPFHLNQL